MLDLVLYILIAISLIAWLLFFIIAMSNYKRTPHLSKKSPESPLRNPPLLSIIIPSRNEEKRIVKCIETLKSQSYTNLEILVVDDSTDNTVNEIKNIAGNDKRIKIIKQESLFKHERR